MFLGTDFMISILHLFISRKALNPFMVMSDPCDWQKTFVKWVLHGIELPIHQNLIYWPSHTAALEWFLRAIWDAASWAAVLILPQIKFSSQLSNCTSLLVNSGVSIQRWGRQWEAWEKTRWGWGTAADSFLCDLPCLSFHFIFQTQIVLGNIF